MDWILYFLFNFVLYSFLGWVLEEVYCFFITGKFKEDGFLNGPFKPMYGSAITILVFCFSYLEIRGVPLIILLIVVPTGVEYISGLGLRLLFQKDYWNYEKNPFNLHGLICFKFSIYWSILSAFIIFLMQPLIDGLYKNLFAIVNIISPLIFIYILLDIIVTVRDFSHKKVIKN